MVRAMKKRIPLLRALLLAMLMALPGGLARAESKPALPVTTGTITRNEARITFEWPKPVNFTAEAEGKTLTITFERNASPDFGKLLSSLYPYIVSARRQGDGKTIVLTMDKPYQIRTFTADAVGGIDILNIDPQRQIAMRDADTFSTLQPAAGEANDSGARPISQHAVPDKDAIVKVGISGEEDSAVLRFPFVERMASAVFIRNNYLWIILGKRISLDLADFEALSKTVIGKGELLHSNTTTVLRMPIQDNVFAAVARQENTFELAVLLTFKKKPPPSPLKITINTDPPAPAHVFVPTLEMADPTIVQDPVIGDDLIVTPLYNIGEGITFTREFVDFSLLESTQGVVVAKKTDTVAVTQLRNGLRISLPQGAALTPDLPEVDEKAQVEALQRVATLFPFESWKPEASLPRRSQIRILFHKIVDSADVQGANDIRLRLAQIYLSEGMAAESMALLDGINRTDPAAYRSQKLSAMHGAANFLMYRFADAARDFAAVELNNNKEIDYWRNMLTDLLGSPGQYDFMEMNPDYISKYPPAFRQRLAIVAADRSIETKDFNNAIRIFDTLHPKDSAENLTLPIANYVNFLMAKIAADTGQEKDAIDTWNKLADDYKSPFVRARAEFSRIAWGMEHGTMRKDEITERLERLRLAWHGDSLELRILGLLGDLYSEKKDYVNAMRIWDGAVNAFPSSGAALEMSRRMEDTFVLMFTEGTVDSLPAFDALSLYYQYRKYAPSGSSAREMAGRLADRLISLDLLEQAATLLEHQMRAEAEKIQRSQVGVKVATVRLLNRQPKKALEALEDSVYGENPVLLRLLRNRLAAESLSEMGQYDRAISILGQDDTMEAEMIRLNVYWEQKDWKKVISSVESMLKERKDATAPITLEESQFILQLALAYIFESDAVQLQYLHDYFGPLMANNPNKAVFNFITSSEVHLDPTNFDEVVNYLSDTRTFLNNYKARIALSGIDSIVPKEEKKEPEKAPEKEKAK